MPSATTRRDGRCLCGESRSGPDPVNLGGRGVRKDARAARSLADRGSRRFEVVLVDRTDCRSRRQPPATPAKAGGAGQAPRRKALWTGEASPPLTGRRGIGGPGDSSRNGPKGTFAGSRDRGRQRQARDLRSWPKTPGRGSAARRTRDHGFIRAERGWALGRPRAIDDRCRSWRLDVNRGSTRSCAHQGFGRVVRVEARSRTKVDGEGDSRVERSRGCSCRKSVADVGRAHLPCEARRAERRAEPGQGQLDAAVPRRRRGPIRGG